MRVKKEQTAKVRENKKMRHVTFEMSSLSHLKLMWHAEHHVEYHAHQTIKPHGVTVSLFICKARRNCCCCQGFEQSQKATKPLPFSALSIVQIASFA